MRLGSLRGHNQKVFETLQNSEKPLGAYDILAMLQRYGIETPPTIYRALEKLMLRFGALYCFIKHI